MRRTLQIGVAIVAFIATTAPIAHVLEMPSKLVLNGPLWLSVQQHLYRGWGPVFGPVEIFALALSAAMFLMAKGDRAQRRAYLVATLCYAGMIGVFFLYNNPVNQALNGWTAATLPGNWPDYRLEWEVGHATSALLSLIAFAAGLRAFFQERVAAGQLGS